jgi:putative copper resistance protein D
MYQASIIEVWREGGLGIVLTETRFGQVWLIRLGLAIALALLLASPTTFPRAGGLVQVILATGLLISLAWIGHAGATPGPAGQFHLTADVLHLAAVGVWIGGLSPLVMLLSAANRSNGRDCVSITTAVHRFSLFGITSVGVLLATGIVNSWYLVGSVNNLVETVYGQLVLLKLGLFAALVVIATVNRFHLTPQLPSAQAARKLLRNSMVETALGLAVVFVVGLLGTLPPAVHSHHHVPITTIPADASFVHIHSKQGMADVIIEPGHTGTASATIRLWTEDFRPLDAQEVSVILTGPDGSKPTTRSASLGSDAAWRTDGIELSRAGNWTVAVDALLGESRHLKLDAQIKIEPK